MHLDKYILDEVILSILPEDTKAVIYKFISADGEKTKSIMYQSISLRFILDVKLIASSLLGKSLDETTFKDVQELAKGLVNVEGIFTIEEQVKELVDHTFTTQYLIKRV